MTFPTVESEASSQQDTNTTTHTVSMPSGVVAGNTLVAAIALDARPAVSGTIPDDWTALGNTADSGDNNALRVYTKVATGSEGATQVINTDIGQCSSHHVWRLSGVSATALAVAVEQGGSAGTSANPAALNPAGWDAEDTLWLVAASVNGGDITVTGFPSSYVGTGQVNSDSSADGVTLGYASRENNTASEDPGAFTLSASATWCTATIGVRPAAPVDFVALGAKSAGGTTTVSVAYPTGVAAGRLAIAGRTAWQDAVTTASETGWLNHTDLLGGLVGTNTIDSHQTRVAADTRELDGSETGSVTFDQGGTANGALGVMSLYAKSPSSTTWDIATTSGDDNTHAANRSVTASGSVTLQPDDVVVAVVAVDTDASLAVTAPAITASGITFGTTTRRTSGAGVGTGNDGNVDVFDARVTAGTGTAAPALAFTIATSQCGPVVFLRLRAASGSVTGTVAVTQADDTTTTTGQLGYAATSTAAQDAQTSTASGTVDPPVTGTADPTQAADTPAGSGQLGYTATAAADQAAHTSTASGAVTPPATATGAPTQDDQTSTAAGQLGYVGTSATSQADDTSTASGLLGYSGTAAANHATQTATASGHLGYTATSTAAQDAQTGDATGTANPPVTGTAAVTQAAQTATASGIYEAEGFSGIGTATQAAQTAAGAGQLGYTATGAATQAADTPAGSGQLGRTATGAAAQDAQTAAGSGQLGYSAAGSSAQAAHTATASGLFLGQLIGAVAALQTTQTSTAAGLVVNPGEVYVPPVAATYIEAVGASFAEPAPATYREPAAVTYME